MNKIITSKGVMDINIPYDLHSDKGGEHYMICPICTPSRKPEHQKEEKFAVNVSKNPMPWRCNHCGEGGYVITEEYMQKAKFKPVITNFEYLSLSDGLVVWFWEKRAISKQTLEKMKICMSNESIRQGRVSEKNIELKDRFVQRKCINFKYFKDGILINIKFRDPDKNFKMVSDATKTLYNIDSFKGKKKGIITEGEIDVLSYIEAGLDEDFGIGSVPNGATITDKERKYFEETGKINITSEINLEYLDNIIDDELKNIEIFYLATDDDAPGIKLREELARRLGKERCRYIKFSDFKKEDGGICKDANEVLISKGKAVLASTIDSSIPYPVSGVINLDDYWDQLSNFYDKGKPKGKPTGYPALDPYFNWMFGWFMVLNGFPNMGKTIIALNLIAVSVVLYKWKWGIYCPENYPVHNIIDMLSEVLVGKTLDPESENRMSRDEYERVVKFIKNYIYPLDDNDNGYSPEELRTIKRKMVMQYGIVGFFTDPWSSLVHNYRNFDNEDKYLEYQLSQEVRIATKMNIINLISHHPRTPKDIDKVPSAFELTGGKLWWIKAYSIIAVQRKDLNDWKNLITEFHVQKNKDFKAAGELTTPANCPTFKFDRRSRRFYCQKDGSETEAPHDFFPFKDYQENNTDLFEGF